MADLSGGGLAIRVCVIECFGDAEGQEASEMF
jgi:hypothetical protein